MTKRVNRPHIKRQPNPFVFVKEGDCLRCTSHRPNSKGRVQVNRKGKLFLVYRLLWEEQNGPIPAGKVLMHSCDNVWCHELSHLSVGTQLDNVRDSIAKGRQGPSHQGNPGPKHWNGKGGISQGYQIKMRKLRVSQG